MSSNAPSVCAQTHLQIKECNDEERGRGYLVSCLVDHRGNISEYQCNQYITKMTSIIFSDYRLICGFMDKCKEDVNNLHCGSINVGHKVGSGRDRFLPLFLEVYEQKMFTGPSRMDFDVAFADGSQLHFVFYGGGLLSRTSTHKVR